jgi:hypothetical protein
MKDYKYQSAEIDIAVGETVTWPNHDPEPHNVAILQGPELNVSPEIREGEQWSMKFRYPGKYHYYCEWHPWMEGDVVVGGSQSTQPVNQETTTFKETGKTIRGIFRKYWNERGGLAQQGFPISEEMQEKSDTDGKYYIVQYFERAVFELHPDYNEANRVLLSQLGTFKYKSKYMAKGAAVPTAAAARTPVATRTAVATKIPVATQTPVATPPSTHR